MATAGTGAPSYMNRDLLSSLVASLSRSGSSVLDAEVLDFVSDFSNVMVEYGRLVFSRRVGSGANAVVYKGRYKRAGAPRKRVALKVYTPTDISVDVIKRWLREVRWRPCPAPECGGVLRHRHRAAHVRRRDGVLPVHALAIRAGRGSPVR